MQPIDDATRAAVLTDLLAGRRSDAIERYARAAGVGDDDAAAVVDALLRGDFGAPPPAPSVAGAPFAPDGSPLSSVDEASVFAELRAGQKIAAIARYRRATGVSLSEAKRAVEAMAERAGIAATPAAIRPVPFATIVVALVIAVVIGAVAIALIGRVPL